MTDYAMVTPQPGGPENFERREIAPDAPGPGQLRLRQTAIGLNFIDIYHRRGTYPWPVDRDLVVGSEAAGVVEAVGPGVEGLSVGDRVAYTIPMGAYASVRVVPADRVVAIPDAISDAVAATVMLKGMTAHYLLHSSHAVRPGDQALVHAAAGGVGLLLGQWLRAKGVTAIGTAGGAAKCALARDHGYAHVIDYDREDFVARVADITGGHGVDVVYDGVAGTTWRGSLQSLAVRGSYVCFGQAAGPVTGFQLSDLAPKSAKATRPSLFHFIADPEELRVRASEMFAALARGDITSTPRQEFALADVAKAHAALENRQTSGATVLIP
ncbi:quinone oxidoreductase family protein [Paracoccus spongiarum]|uniref:Quinone oxidoreductase n=1 Tax=Paracoccus spongiarum TaxID=3064387 RepID=A0ABT9JCK4_9RHOB|nr:quinone oxidoreductase [Paracoccus sp. 2205BS29-5]MDP5307414.1 quinone oxidoreductase [Paracoccus sp. 2205BS29-5]